MKKEVTPDCQVAGFKAGELTYKAHLEWLKDKYLHIESQKFIQRFSEGFSGGSTVKNLPAMQEDVGSIPKSGRSPEGKNETHSSVHAWEIPWTEEPGGLQSMGLKESHIAQQQDSLKEQQQTWIQSHIQ